MKVFTVPEMIAAEQAADAAGHSYAQMMETAGRAVAEALISRRQTVDGLAVLVLVGPGNNGGDALVAGRYLYWAGARVVFYLWQKLDPAQNPNLQQAIDEEIPVLNAEDDQRYRVLRLRLTGVDVVIDGLLGTGVSRPIAGELARLLRQVRAGLEERARLAAEDAAQACRDAGFEVPLEPVKPRAGNQSPWRLEVVAVDCPSGLNCDSGALDPLALPADLTVTFAGPKRGHFLFPGAAACGELLVADIGIDARHTRDVPLTLPTAAEIADLIPPRPVDGHKGTFGRVLIAGGSAAYRGAPFLAAQAALRAGSGLVTLAVPRPLHAAGAMALPEATYWVPPDEAVWLTEAAGQALGQALDPFQAVLIGPGLSIAAGPFLQALLRQLEGKITVFDADALNLLAAEPGWYDLLPTQSILTPHPGEMARLCGLDSDQLAEQNRFDLALEKAAAWRCVLVLKGAFTIIAAPGGQGWIMPFANPLLATPGSGDVLAGVILSLVGQGVGPEAAAVGGAFWHGLAGELAAEQFGPAGLLAGELANWLPAARNKLKVGR